MERRLGRYALLREVARGGSGAVFQARDPQGRLVALKLLLAGRAATALQRRRFQTEVQSLLRLRHPQVVALLDAGESDGQQFLAMEWVEGESLQDRLDREGPLVPRVAAALVRDLARAVHHAHGQGVLHRDLKPGNVLLRRSDGAALVSDFGLASDLHEQSSPSASGSSALARSIRGVWLGTPGWWPPEQAMGELDQVGPRSDVYGLGAVLYGALTGQPPHEVSNAAELLASLGRDPTPPSQLEPGIPPALDAICTRALAREPGARHPDAAALAADLESFVTPTGEAAGAPQGVGRGQALLAVAALIGLVASAARALGPERPLPERRSPVPGDANGAAEACLARAAACRARDPEAALRILAEGELEPRLRASAEEAARLCLQVGRAAPHEVPTLLARPGAAALLPELQERLRTVLGDELRSERAVALPALTDRLSVLAQLSPPPRPDPLTDALLLRVGQLMRTSMDMEALARFMERLARSGLRPTDDEPLGALLTLACQDSTVAPTRAYPRVLAAALELDAELFSPLLGTLGDDPAEYPPGWAGSLLLGFVRTYQTVRLPDAGRVTLAARRQLLTRLRARTDPLGPRARARGYLRCLDPALSLGEGLEIAHEAARADPDNPWVMGQLARCEASAKLTPDAVAHMVSALERLEARIARRTGIYRQQASDLLAEAVQLFAECERPELAGEWVDRLRAQGLDVSQAERGPAARDEGR